MLNSKRVDQISFVFHELANGRIAEQGYAPLVVGGELYQIGFAQLVQGVPDLAVRQRQ